jgi:hypothetical protein
MAFSPVHSKLSSLFWFKKRKQKIKKKNKKKDEEAPDAKIAETALHVCTHNQFQICNKTGIFPTHPL